MRNDPGARKAIVERGAYGRGAGARSSRERAETWLTNHFPEALANAAANVPLAQTIIYAGLGDHDRAFAALERGAAAGDPKIGGVLTYPEMIALRQDPRYEALRRRIGLEGR